MKGDIYILGTQVESDSGNLPPPPPNLHPWWFVAYSPHLLPRVLWENKLETAILEILFRLTYQHTNTPQLTPADIPSQKS